MIDTQKLSDTPAARIRALVQAPRRKMHLASIRPGDSHWLTFHDTEIPAGPTTQFWTGDVDKFINDDIERLCVHCYRFLLLEQLILREHGITNVRRTA